MPSRRMPAKAVPPAGGQKDFPAWFRAEVAAVVFTVRDVVCGVELLILTEAGILQVAGSLAAIGVTLQLRVIDPVKPPVGVRVMVDVFPDVAPGVTVTGVPVMEKPG